MPLPDDDHFSRYCKPKAVDRHGDPLAAAFELRPDEVFLSGNWLEHFEASDVESAVECVREAFRQKGYEIKKTGRFAVLRVGAAAAAVTAETGQPSSVEHKPLEDDASHAGLVGYTAAKNFAVAALLRALVKEEGEVHPGVVVA